MTHTVALEVTTWCASHFSGKAYFGIPIPDHFGSALACVSNGLSLSLCALAIAASAIGPPALNILLNLSEFSIHLLLTKFSLEFFSSLGELCLCHICVARGLHRLSLICCFHLNLGVFILFIKTLGALKHIYCTFA